MLPTFNRNTHPRLLSESSPTVHDAAVLVINRPQGGFPMSRSRGHPSGTSRSRLWNVNPATFKVFMTWNWHEQVLMKYGITKNHHNPQVSRISKNRCRIDNASATNRTALGFHSDAVENSSTNKTSCLPAGMPEMMPPCIRRSPIGLHLILEEKLLSSYFPILIGKNHIFSNNS